MNRVRLLIFSTFLLSGCAIGPVGGIIYTNTKFAGEFNPANDVRSVKTARGCTHSILSLIAFGNAGAGKIAFKSGIKRIATIDHSTLNILTFIYYRYCTIVTGE